MTPGSFISCVIIFICGVTLLFVKDSFFIRDIKLAESICESHGGWTQIKPSMGNTMHVHCVDGYAKRWAKVEDGNK